MTQALDTLKPGQIVWTKGANEYGDDATGGCFIRSDHDPETGEAVATLLTYSPAAKRQASLYLQHKGKFTNLGLLARLIRVPTSDITPPADDFRSYADVWQYALRALIASALPPHHLLGEGHHDDLVTAYRVLRDEAVSLRRGVQ